MHIPNLTKKKKKEKKSAIFDIPKETKLNIIFKIDVPIAQDDPNAWEGIDKDWKRLQEAWARPGRWRYRQPLDLIR